VIAYKDAQAANIVIERSFFEGFPYESRRTDPKKEGR
jgi:hypothetical protein